MKQTKFWILLFAALAILGCGAFLLLRSHGQTGQTAVIRVDGDVYQRIDLRAVTIPYDIEVQTEWGSNTVHVEPGYPRDELALLAGAGYKFKQWPGLNHYFGGANAVGQAGAGGDPRRGGVGLLL